MSAHFLCGCVVYEKPEVALLRKCDSLLRPCGLRAKQQTRLLRQGSVTVGDLID